MPDDMPPQETRPASADEQVPLPMEWLPGRYAVARLDPAAPLPDWLPGVDGGGLAGFEAPLITITRSDQELSILAPESSVPQTVRAERGWVACRVAGTLDFSMVGILARLTGALADAGISVFAVSTFDTDYLLVKETDQSKAAHALDRFAHPK